MRRSERLLRNEFAATQAPLLQAKHAPGYIYTSDDVYEREVETIFLKDWMCIGREEEFAKPGDYRSFRIAGEPLLVVRNRAGQINAFVNACRHRGVEVATGQGNASKFTCPYHAWLYDLDGRLISAPFNDGVRGFDFDHCALPPVRLETWAGWIFVNFDADAQDLGAYLDEDRVRELTAFLRQDELRLADRWDFELDCNWKLVLENLMDMYHTGVIHASSFGKVFPRDDFQYRLTANGYHAEYQSLTMCPDGKSPFGAMPWMGPEQAPWMKASGKGVDRNHPLYAFTILVRPCMNIFARYDLVQPITYFPLGPNKTEVSVFTLFPASLFERPDFDAEVRPYKDFIRAVIEEDRAMLRSLQQGLKSRRFTPGPTVALEMPIHHMLNRYLDRLFGSERRPAKQSGAPRLTKRQKQRSVAKRPARRSS